MSKPTYMILQTPPVIALSTALISAAVALIVAVVSQWALSRRARRELLTKKLEELYLVLNDAASDCGNRYAEVHKCFREPEHMASESFYSHQAYSRDLQAKMVMYVKLYFPRLSQTYYDIFVAHGRLSELIQNLMSDTPPKIEEFGEAVTNYAKCLGVMEDEIVSNKPLLVGSPRLFHRYRTPSNVADKPPRARSLQPAQK
jgi:hypothetical protein